MLFAYFPLTHRSLCAFKEVFQQGHGGGGPPLGAWLLPHPPFYPAQWCGGTKKTRKTSPTQYSEE